MNKNLQSLTLLGESGDTTITFDKEDENTREKMIEYIDSKMNDGYTFFVIKKFLGIPLYKKEVTNPSIDVKDSFVVSDNLAEKLSKDNSDVGMIFGDDKYRNILANTRSKAHKTKDDTFDTVSIAKDANEVLNNNTIASPQLVGG